MTTARTAIPTLANAGSQKTRILWYRLLDSLQSRWNRYWKTRAGRKRWGKDVQLIDYVRSGRRYSRVKFVDSASADADGYYVIRPEPGWEWICQQCKTRSFVTAAMIAEWQLVIETTRVIRGVGGVKLSVARDHPSKWQRETIRTDLLQEWEDLARKTAVRGFKPPVKPTPATAPCPNCKYRPGAPE